MDDAFCCRILSGFGRIYVGRCIAKTQVVSQLFDNADWRDSMASFWSGRGPTMDIPMMDKKRLEYYKKKLVTRRAELLRGIARTEQEGREADEDPTVDLADKAANSYTKEFLFGLTHENRSLLQLVDDALARIQGETFGECASCHQELQQKRLEAVPWTRYCIACQEKKEQGLL